MTKPSTPAARTKSRKTYEELRSARWMAPDDLRSFGHRSRMMQMGYAPEDWAGRPVIASASTRSGCWTLRWRRAC